MLSPLAAKAPGLLVVEEVEEGKAEEAAREDSDVYNRTSRNAIFILRMLGFASHISLNRTHFRSNASIYARDSNARYSYALCRNENFRQSVKSTTG